MATPQIDTIHTSDKQYDQETHLDNLITIARCTGLSLDDMVHWFEGVDLTRVVENVERMKILHMLSED